jgi:dihydroorotase
MKFICPQLFDAHLHLREGDLLKKILPYSHKTCSQVVVMPNLKEMIINKEQAQAYYN